MNDTSTKPAKTGTPTKETAKAAFTDEDVGEAQKAIRSIEARPAYSRKQMQVKLEDEILAALGRGVSLIQLTETLSQLSIAVPDSFITALRRRARAANGPGQRSTDPDSSGQMPDGLEQHQGSNDRIA